VRKPLNESSTARSGSPRRAGPNHSRPRNPSDANTGSSRLALGQIQTHRHTGQDPVVVVESRVIETLALVGIESLIRVAKESRVVTRDARHAREVGQTSSKGCAVGDDSIVHLVGARVQRRSSGAQGAAWE